MENLIIEKTKSMPGVDFITTGQLSIKGRLLAEDASVFFEPLILWVEKLVCSDVVFTIAIDYMNTASSKLLFTLLRMLDENENIKGVYVNWVYEEDDEELLETGEYFMESLMRTSFRFFAVKEELKAA